jgi:hypothetical protein
MLLRPAPPNPTSALLSVKAPINLSFFDRRLNQYLLSSQHAVLIARENERTSPADDYWRVEESR